MSPRAPRWGPEELDVLIEKLDPEDLRMIASKAAERHEDVARAVRLAATRGSGDLSQLKTEIDRGLRTSRYLGYRESGGWAMQARPIVEAISEAVGSSPTAELVVLIERAIGHVVKVILKADDSDGTIGPCREPVRSRPPTTTASRTGSQSVCSRRPSRRRSSTRCSR
ncbi:MAG: hypothetical protein ACYDGN_04760 [Acidimicrobiales bacterium]